MGLGGLTFGELANALAMTDADPDYIEEIRRRAALEEAAPNPTVDVGPITMPEQPYQAQVGSIEMQQPARDLPPRAEQALAAYQAQQPIPDASERIRVREDRPPEQLPEDNLGVATPTRFDPQQADTRGTGPSVEVGPLALLRQEREIPAYEDTNRALAMTGSQYRVPDVAIEQRDTQPNPYVEEQVLPEDVDDALAMVGSDYRVPQRDALRRTESAGAMLDRLDANTNEAVTLKQQQGAIASSGADRAQALRSQASVEGDMRLTEALERRDAAMARKDDNTKQAYESLRAMQKQLGEPPDTTKGKTLRIIGAILSMSPKGANIGKGLALLGQTMGDDVQAWSRGIEASDTLRRAFTDMARSEDQSIGAELSHEESVSRLAAATYINALEANAAGTQSEEAKRVARELILGVENTYLQHNVDVKQRTEALEATARKESARSAEDWNITRTLADLPEQHRADVAARIGPRAVELLADMQKNEATQAGIEETRAKTEKERHELTAGPKLTEGERKVDDLIEGIAGPNGPYARLERIVKAGKGDPSKMDMPRFGVGGVSSVVNNPLSGWLVPEENVQQDADIQALTETVLRAESGASITAGDIKAKADALGINSTDETVRARALISLMQRARAIDNQGRLTRPAGANSKIRFAPDPPSIKQVVAGRGRGAQ